MAVELGSPCYLDKWDESSLAMSPISNLFTPDVEQHAQQAGSEGSSTEASFCSSDKRATRGSSSLGCSHEEPPWLGQDASTLRLEARLSAIESTLELRCAALEAKMNLLTSTAAQDAETAKERMHLLQQVVDNAALKFRQSCDVSAAQTADLSECLRQSSDTQARLKADMDKIWFQVNTCVEALSAAGLQHVPDSAPSSPSGDQQEQRLLPVRKGPQCAGINNNSSSSNSNSNNNNVEEPGDEGRGVEAFRGEWDKLMPRITDLEDLMHLLRKDDQAQMKALQTDLQKLTPRVEDLEAMQQADWERLAPRVTSLEACQLDLQKLGPRITELEAVMTESSEEEVPKSEQSKSSQATAESEKPEPALKESQAEAIINQLVPRISGLEENMDHTKSRVEDLEVALSGYVEDMSSLTKVQSLPVLQQAVSTGLLESGTPSAHGETNQDSVALISVRSASTLPEEDREPVPAGSFVLDGRVVSPPVIHEEALEVDSCLTEAVHCGEGYSPQAFGGSGSVLEASLPSCTTVEPELANSLPSTPGATAGPHPMMPGSGRGTCASLSPSGSQSALVDSDNSRVSTAARQSRAAAAAVVANTCVVGPSPVLGMQSQFPPQMQQQQQQQQHGSQPSGRQASQRRWTAPPQSIPGVPPPPDAWSPPEPQPATSVERQQGSVHMISEGISSLPLALMQAEMAGQVPPQSRRSLPAGLHPKTSSTVVYKTTSVNPPSVQPPPVQQSTPQPQQQQQQQPQQQQQTSRTPRRQQTPMRATTPTRQHQQQQPSQPQTPRMAPLGPPLQIPPPPIPAMRGSVGSQHALKQRPPAHKQQHGAQDRRPSNGTPQLARPRLCAGYSMSPRRCIHSWRNESQSTPASVPTSPLLTARR